MKDSCPLRKEYAEYSGLEATYADSGIEYPRRDYCAWLEKELTALRESRILSAVPSGDTPEPCKHRYDSLKIDWAYKTVSCKNCGKELINEALTDNVQRIYADVAKNKLNRR